MPKHIAHVSANPQLAALIIRCGLAIVLAYAAIDAFREPNAWLSFIPAFSTKYLAAKTSLDTISVVQLGLAVWLLSGKYIRYAALVTIALLAGVMIFNLNTLLITFRDFGLIAAALALFFLD